MLNNDPNCHSMPLVYLYFVSSFVFNKKIKEFLLSYAFFVYFVNVYFQQGAFFTFDYLWDANACLLAFILIKHFYNFLL